MELDVKAATTPRRLLTSLKRDLKDPRYLAEIEESRADMFAGRRADWQHVLDAEPTRELVRT